MPTFLDSNTAASAASLSLAHLLNVPGSSDTPIPAYRRAIHCSTGVPNLPSSTANTTEYWLPLGYGSNPSTTEATQQIIYRTPGTISNLYLRLNGNGISGGASTFKLRKNGADSGCSISIPSSTSGEFEDTTNTTSLAAGDLLCYQTVPGATTGILVLSILSFILNTTGLTNETCSRFAAGNTIVPAVISNTRKFFPLNGNSSTTTVTEANCSITQQKAGNYKNLAVKLSANAATSPSTCSLRKNGADSVVTISIPTATSGTFEDTAHSLAVVANDTICYGIISGSANNITMQYIAVDWNDPTTTNITQLVSSSTNQGSVSSTTTVYYHAHGTIGFTSTEVDTKLRAGRITYFTAVTLSNLTANIAANTRDNTTTLTLRINGSDATQTVSIPASTAGVFTDATHTDSLSLNNDVINYKVVTTGTTGSFTPANYAMWTVGPTVPPPQNIVRSLAVETVPVSENLVKSRGKTRVVPTETVTVSGGTLTRQAGKKRVLPTETVYTFDQVTRISSAEAIPTFSLNSSYTGQTVGFSNTYYLGIFGMYFGSSTESEAQVVMRTPAKLSSLFVNIEQNFLSSATVITCRKNAANGNQTISVPAGMTGMFYDLMHTDSFAAGDKVSVSLAAGSGSNYITVQIISFLLQNTTASTSEVVTRMVVSPDTFEYKDANTTYYVPIIGNGADTASILEAPCKCRQQKSGTFRNMATYVPVNTRSSASTIRSRKNAANGNLSISISATTTGTFEDLTHSDSVSAGDDFDFSISLGTGPTTEILTPSTIQSDFVSATEKITQFALTIPDDSFQYDSPGSSPDYFGLSGMNYGNLENVVKTRLSTQYAFLFSNLTIRVPTNQTTSGSSTLTFRKNGTDTSLSVSISAGTTGVFTNSSNTVSAIGEDLVNTAITVVGSSGERLYYTTISLWAAYQSPSAGNNITRSLTENVTVSAGTLTRQTAKTRALPTETVAVSEAKARQAGKKRALATETVVVSEQVLKSRGKTRTLTENVTVSESLARQVNKIRALATQTVAVGESIARVVGKSRALPTETVPVSETKTRQTNKKRSLPTESVPVSENLNRLAGKIRALATQTVAVSDQVLKSRGKSRTLTENVAVSENLQRQAAKKRSLSTESVPVSESAARQANKKRALATETVVVSGGTLTKVKTIVRALAAETVAVGESLTRQAAKKRSLATQTVPVSENLGRSSGKVRALPTEIVAISESVARVVGHAANVVRTLTENVPISENLARQAKKNRVLTTQTVPVSDNLVKSRGKTRVVPTETVVVSGGTLTRKVSRVRALLEFVSISDRLRAFKNGIELLPIPPADRGGFTVPYKKPLMPRLKQILYPVYIIDERRILERRRKLREYPPLVIIPAFQYNINQVVAPFIITDPVKNKVYVRFALSDNRNADPIYDSNRRSYGSIVFDGKAAIPITIKPSQEKAKRSLNKARCASFIMSQKTIEKYGNRLGKLSKIMNAWFTFQQIMLR